MYIKPCKNGDKLDCPVCGKSFVANDGTKFWANGGWTCSWKCFLTAHTESMQPMWNKKKEESAKSSTKETKSSVRKRRVKDNKVNSAYNKMKREIESKVEKINAEESLDNNNIEEAVKNAFRQS